VPQVWVDPVSTGSVTMTRPHRFCMKSPIFPALLVRTPGVRPARCVTALLA